MSKTISDPTELFTKAQKLYDASHFGEAIRTIKELLYVARGDMRIKALDLLAKICLDKDMVDKAIDIYLKSIKHISADNWWEFANIYNKLGSLYLATKKLDDALKYQKLCLEALEKDGNQSFQAITYRNLGRIYTLMGDHINALRTHQKSLELKRTTGDKKGEALSYETMAQDAEFEDDYDTAMDSYNKALEIYRNAGLKEDSERILSAMDALNASKDAISELDDEEMYLFHARDSF